MDSFGYPKEAGGAAAGASTFRPTVVFRRWTVIPLPACDVSM